MANESYSGQQNGFYPLFSLVTRDQFGDNILILIKVSLLAFQFDEIFPVEFALLSMR